MGTVFLATDTRHGRPVAIKALRPEVSDAIGSERFATEIETAARLQHPHILPVYDSGGVDRLLFFVSPYVEGETLRELIAREGPLQIDEALSIAYEVADALAFAHRHGVVHRDVKPGNILLSDGHALLADFGIALSADVTKRITDSGVTLGTAEYMSPEQGTGGQVGPATDIYALGCVLHEMLAGEPPFSSRTVQATIAKHVAEPPPLIRVVRPAVPEGIEGVVRRALAKLPADRYQTAEEFAQALARPQPTEREGAIRIGRRPLVAALSIAVLAVVIGALFWSRPVLNERDLILVADIVSPLEDPGLGEAFRELVTAELDRSRYVRTMQRRSLNASMRLAQVPETTFVDIDLARQLAFRSAIRAVVVGSVEMLDEQSYSTVLHLVDAESGENLASVATQGPDLIASAESLVRDLRAIVGERRELIEANLPLRRAMTPSFEAYRKYLAASKLENQADIPAAVLLLREALELDEDFAVAWTTLGARYLSARELDSARVAYGRALALTERLTPAQRYRAEADVAWTIDQDLGAAIRWYDLLLEEAPGTISALNNRAILLSSVGRYEDARTDLRRAVDLHAFGPELIQTQLLNLAAAHIVVGQLRQATDVIADLDGALAMQAELMYALASGDWPGVIRLSSEVDEDASIRSFLRSYAAMSGVSAAAAQGRPTVAARRLEELETRSSGALAVWYAAAGMLLSRASGVPLGEPSPTVSSSTAPGAALMRGLRAAHVGDRRVAESLLDSIRGLRPADLRLLGYGPLLLEAELAAGSSDWARVVEILARPATAGEHDALSLIRPSSFTLRWVVADAYSELGQADSAAHYFGLAVQPTNIPPAQYALRGLLFAFAHLRISEIDQARGHANSAIDHLSTFLDAVEEPDRVVAPLRDAASRRLTDLKSGRRR
jgi:serine/threonine-protein kinase